jgi:hypothetical protein
MDFMYTILVVWEDISDGFYVYHSGGLGVYIGWILCVPFWWFVLLAVEAGPSARLYPGHFTTHGAQLLILDNHHQHTIMTALISIRLRTLRIMKDVQCCLFKTN